MLKIDGELEIDHARGVIYFHTPFFDIVKSITVLRLCNLPIPIPENQQLDYRFIRPRPITMEECLELAKTIKYQDDVLVAQTLFDLVNSRLV